MLFPTSMSDNEIDITSSLALAAKNESDLDSDSGSDHGFSDSDTGDVQDIISDDDELSDEEVAQPKKKAKKMPSKTAVSAKDAAAFPSLQFSDDEDEEAPSGYFAQEAPAAKKAKAGSFASFGLGKRVVSNIARKGYRQPTPIQRKTIPLIIEGRDVVGMARTGSGKTAAFVLPVVEKLKVHTAKVGARAVILSPSRELALQTYKQVKEFSRGSDLRTVVLIGGDSLEEQFQSMMSNPDIVVATPGRFLHLKVEMDLDLKTVEYIVFDEADRLFEMGFADQLNELLLSLPPTRQSLLFLATLPSTLVDFAKAGLTNPVLVRLDAEAKISENLQMAFFSMKSVEREAALLHVLGSVIKMPFATPELLAKLKNEKDDLSDEEEDPRKFKKRKFKKERLPPANALPSPHSTIVFVPTKHHVEYITRLLRDAGYLVSYIYGSLDQRARREQLYRFRIGLLTILVVTDVAARGIDIPVLPYVINMSLPALSKIFIHRVGRTARAGNKGWAYSLVSENELPYMLDLELFLGKKVLLTSMHERRCELLKESKGSEYVEPQVQYSDRLVLGAFPRILLEDNAEIYTSLMRNDFELKVLMDVAVKGEKLYQRTRQAASPESIKRAKELMSTGSWDEQHLLFGPNLEKEKEKFLAKLANRNVKETVFEFSKKGKEKEEDSMVNLMNRRRRQIAPLQRRSEEKKALLEKERFAGLTHTVEDEILKGDGEVGYKVTSVGEEELAEAFENADEIPSKALYKPRKSFKDPQFYMSHHLPAEAVQDQQLSVTPSFAHAAASATFDIGADDKSQTNSQVMRWDKKKGKYINSRSADGKKYIMSENGTRIPASFKLGKFDDWKKLRRIESVELVMADSAPMQSKNRNFKHKRADAPKLPDKFRNDYHLQKKKVQKALDNGVEVKGYNKFGQRLEMRLTTDIRRAREQKDKRRAKNARPAKRR